MPADKAHPQIKHPAFLAAVREEVENHLGRPIMMAVLVASTDLGRNKLTELAVNVSDRFGAPDLDTAIQATIELAVDSVKSENCPCPTCNRRLDRLQRALAVMSEETSQARPSVIGSGSNG